MRSGARGRITYFAGRRTGGLFSMATARCKRCPSATASKPSTRRASRKGGWHRRCQPPWRAAGPRASA